MELPRHRSSTLKPTPLRLPPLSPTPRPASPTPRPTSPTPTQHSQHITGIRAHFAHLLPKHAVFTVTLTLHQLHNVPLVHGEFGLKWKIKGVTSNGLLHKVKTRKSQSKLSERARLPVTRTGDTDNTPLFDAASDTYSVGSTHSINGGHPTHTQPVPIPAVVVSTSSMVRSTSGTSSVASVSSASSIPSSQFNTRFPNPPAYLSADWSRQPNDDISQTSSKFNYSPAKGITSFVRLKEHNVLWEQTLKFMVQMSVGRDNGELGNSLAKFVVTQRVIAGDPDAPRNPRLGVVYLNLAQYVDAGVITRRYLLRQSKTNATLKLTVHVEHTAGELAYVAPPLPKDEILSGVASFLESSDVYRIRPHVSDLYTNTSSESSLDDAVVASDTSSVVSGSGVSNGGSHSHTDHRHATIKKQRQPFEISKLPTINDPRGTEKLIEALFNPVPVTQPSKVTPFTYLVDVDGDGDGDHSSYAATTDTRPDMATLADGEGDDSSLYADSQDESVDGADGLGSDYHSLRSHPSFQGSLRSKHSSRSLASKVGSKYNDPVEDPVVNTDVHLLSGATERRTWWQKVLSPPAAG